MRSDLSLVFYLLGIPVNFITCVFVSVLIGLSGDNAIQYLLHHRDKEFGTDMPEVGKASLQVALWGTLGSLVFVFSGFRFIQMLGMVFALGFILGTFGDYHVLTALLGLRKRSDRSIL